VAALISLPFQLTHDRQIGAERGGERWQLNIQPVLPFDLGPKWNLISRTILPVVRLDGVPPGAAGQSGIGDTVQSVFFSPKAPTAGGWIWGAGPVFLLPTGSDDLLSVNKWGAGPTGVALKQEGAWTYGLLANHIWSFAGSGKQDVTRPSCSPSSATRRRPRGRDDDRRPDGGHRRRHALLGRRARRRSADGDSAW